MIAYLILTHGNVEVTKRFITNLSSQNSHFFIHVDAKANLEDFSSLFNKKNITFTKKRYSVVWKGFSQVLAEGELLQTAVELGGFSYYSLHSGVDMNLVSKRKIELFFKNNSTNYINFREILPNNSYVKYFQNTELWMKIPKWHFYDTLKITWRPNANIFRLFIYRMFVLFNILFVNVFFPKKKIPKDLRYYFGGAWWTMHHTTAKYVVKKFQEQYLFDVFKYTDCPDEMYFQTVVLNSPFAKKTVNNYLRYIDWSSGREKPSILDERDYINILKSEALFGRKIDMVKSKKLLERLKVW